MRLRQVSDTARHIAQRRRATAAESAAGSSVPVRRDEQATASFEISLQIQNTAHRPQRGAICPACVLSSALGTPPAVGAALRLSSRLCSLGAPRFRGGPLEAAA